MDLTTTEAEARMDQHRIWKLASYALVCFGFIALTWRQEATIRDLGGVIEAQAVDDRQEEAQTVQRRIEARGLLFEGCLALNEVRQALDQTFQFIIASALTAPPTEDDPDRAVRLSVLLDALRSRLGPKNCDHVLIGLLPQEADAARRFARSEIETLPLPPVEVPGYVPPNLRQGSSSSAPTLRG